LRRKSKARAREGSAEAEALRKALESLGEEGVTQVFKPVFGGDLVVGAVCQLQLEVLD
jgi:peptide chain release factor 3